MVVPARTASIVGNRLVLIGAIVYLLEWVAILIAGDTGPAEPGTKSPEALLALYAQNPLQQAFLVTWLSLVLLGRIAIPVGIKVALRDSGRPNAFMDVATGAMVVSIALELTTEAVVGAGAYLANHGASTSTIVTLDAIAGWMWPMILAPLGASVLISAWCMMRSGLFPKWIAPIGLVGGTLMIVGGVLAGPAYSESALAKTLSGDGMIGVPIFWLWMLITGAYLFRKTPSKESVVSTA